MNKNYKGFIKPIFVMLLMASLGLACSNSSKNTAGKNASSIDSGTISDDSLLNLVEYSTFQYFWEGAEPTSGLACERIHLDGVYPENDQTTVTTGGSGFGIMALIAGIDRSYITREEGLDRFEKILNFLEKADRFHGAYPHWIEGTTGKVKPFGKVDNGGDLVETAFLMQGLLTAHQYFIQGGEREKKIAQRIDVLWKAVDWDWYRNGQQVLYWHWSPEYAWKMNFPVRGFNECLIMYVLAASSPTHGIEAKVYHQGWAENGAIRSPHEVEGIPLQFKYQGNTKAGPLFWTHYSFLGLDPTGLKDDYGNYFEEGKNLALIHRAYAIKNPNGFKGYGEKSWGFTASYTYKGYGAMEPRSDRDEGDIAPTVLSSLVYTPKYSLEMMRHLYSDFDGKLMGKYGFYDAFNESKEWYPQRYLAIDQGPVPVMIENYRSQLLWKLFMSHPDVQKGLNKLGFSSPHINTKK